MFISIQFPMADSRSFVDKTYSTNRPLWPAPRADYDFVRYFGQIKERPRGGLAGWVGENNLCFSRRALRFPDLPAYWDNESKITIPLKLVYRRFFFDGLVVGKFEIGLYTVGLWQSAPNSRIIQDLLLHILDIIVEIPNPKGKPDHCHLWQAGKYLANLYLLSGVSFSEAKDENLPKWWVEACRPMLFIEERKRMFYEAEGDFPFEGKYVPLFQGNINFTLSHHTIKHHGVSIPIWRMQEGVKYAPHISSMTYEEIRQQEEMLLQETTKGRALRIYLFRLYAERECLKLILANIRTGRIQVEPRSKISDSLQFYLNEATRKISRLESISSGMVDGRIDELARQAEDYISPGERDAVLEALRQIDMRQSIFRKVESYIKDIVVQETIMGDKYVIGQAGAVGRGAKAENVYFQQVWADAGQNIDLAELSEQLGVLRSTLKQKANSLEEDAIVGSVASAEISAKEGDGSKVLEHLAKAGKWALDTAQTIGVSIAAEVIKKAMGM